MGRCDFLARANRRIRSRRCEQLTSPSGRVVLICVQRIVVVQVLDAPPDVRHRHPCPLAPCAAGMVRRRHLTGSDCLGNRWAKPVHTGLDVSDPKGVIKRVLIFVVSRSRISPLLGLGLQRRFPRAGT